MEINESNVGRAALLAAAALTLASAAGYVAGVDTGREAAEKAAAEETKRIEASRAQSLSACAALARRDVDRASRRAVLDATWKASCANELEDEGLLCQHTVNWMTGCFAETDVLLAAKKDLTHRDAQPRDRLEHRLRVVQFYDPLENEWTVVESVDIPPDASRVQHAPRRGSKWSAARRKLRRWLR